MKRLASLLILLPFLALLPSCQDTTPIVSADSKVFYVDQHYYPSLEGSMWRYRIDTTGAASGTVRDVGRRTSRMYGTVKLDSTEYRLQIDDTVMGLTTTTDSLYVRQSSEGVFVTSPNLRNFATLATFLGSFPKEIMIVPGTLQPGMFWSILNFEFNQIPLLQIYFRVSAQYMNKESVQLDMGTIKDCIRIRVDVRAQFPNPQNPQDIFNPIRITETADFWLSQPLGFVMGDGAEAVFALLRGQLPIGLPERRMHQELLGCDIVQPSGGCTGR
jgi:hypothetical protein